jgi:hypothetical protein
MHDGRFATLDAVVDHYFSLGERAIRYDARLPRTALDMQRRADLIAFLNSLTDEAFAHAHGFDGLAVPVSMTIRVAPGRRALIIDRKGYGHPVRPTPFARWQCELHAPMKVGDTITSNSQLGDKFEKNGRKYLVWQVEAYNQHGEKVAEYRATNSWEGAKPEDRSR